MVPCRQACQVYSTNKQSHSTEPSFSYNRHPKIHKSYCIAIKFWRRSIIILKIKSADNPPTRFSAQITHNYQPRVVIQEVQYWTGLWLCSHFPLLHQNSLRGGERGALIMKGLRAQFRRQFCSKWFRQGNGSIQQGLPCLSFLWRCCKKQQYR